MLGRTGGRAGTKAEDGTSTRKSANSGMERTGTGSPSEEEGLMAEAEATTGLEVDRPTPLISIADWGPGEGAEALEVDLLNPRTVGGKGGTTEENGGVDTVEAEGGTTEENGGDDTVEAGAEFGPKVSGQGFDAESTTDKEDEANPVAVSELKGSTLGGKDKSLAERPTDSEARVEKRKSKGSEPIEGLGNSGSPVMSSHGNSWSFMSRPTAAVSLP